MSFFAFGFVRTSLCPISCLLYMFEDWHRPIVMNENKASLEGDDEEGEDDSDSEDSDQLPTAVIESFRAGGSHTGSELMVDKQKQKSKICYVPANELWSNKENTETVKE